MNRQVASAESSDLELISSAIDHYAGTAMGSDPARQWIESHMISTETAQRFRLGFSDRSFGNSLPRSTCEEGRALRKRLHALGLTRSSGHEVFRGCVTLPVTDAGGRVLGIYGHRIYTSLPAGTPRDVWLTPAVGGIFNAASLVSGTIVVAYSIPLALTLISGGINNVVASGRPEGFTDKEVAVINSIADRMVIVSKSRGDTDLVSRVSPRAERVASLSGRPLGDLCARVADAFASMEVTMTISTPMETRPEHVYEVIQYEELPHHDNSESVPTEEPEAGSAAADRSLEINPVPGEVHLETACRHWRIRGATRSKGYELLRANVMVTDKRTGRFHVDTIDFYSSRQRGAFVVAASNELNAPQSQIAAEMGSALLATESAADKAAEPGPEPIPMSDAERSEAMAMLTSPTLIEEVVSDIASLGLVGEEDNALLTYLALVSRKSPRPLSIMVQSSSAAGKSTLADTVAALIPDEDKVSYSALTGQALYYLGASDLTHKVLCVAEDEGAAKATYAIKLLVSAGRLSIASTGKDPDTARLVTKSYEVSGPVSLLMTTTQPEVDDELASRLISISVAESVSQTRAIHDAQRFAYSADGLVSKSRRDAVITRHHNAQRVLEALAVVIPFASELTFTEATTRSRRDHDKYLGLIAASALLHQFQRERKSVEVDGEVYTYVEATRDDAALADRLATGVITRTAMELPPGSAALLRAVSSWTGDKPFTRRAAREALGLGNSQLKVHLARLVELEYAVQVRSGRSVSYQLLWSEPGQNRSAETPREADHEPARRSRSDAVTEEAMRPGCEPIRPGSGRGEAGVKPGAGRGWGKGPSSQLEGQFPPADTPKGGNFAYGDDDSDGDYAYVASDIARARGLT